MQLKRFDGCKTGDEVHLDLGFGMQWVSLIIEHHFEDNNYKFIDKGIKLPFFLDKWQHTHLIQWNNDKTATLITDNIEYTAKPPLFDALLYPILYPQFSYRKSQYEKFVKKMSQ